MANEPYKDNERRLIYWIIHTSNHIIANRPGVPTSATSTGKITLSGLISLSQLIAEYVRRIPSRVFRLFRSIITARSATHAYFKRVADRSSNPSLARSNHSHGVWIDGLVEAFRALGGERWEAERIMGRGKGMGMGMGKNNGLIFSNRFVVLSLYDGVDGDARDEHAGVGIMAPRKRQDVTSYEMMRSWKQRESARSAASGAPDVLHMEHSHVKHDGGLSLSPECNCDG
ncbi:hypothetical protein BDW42DRAFT_128105 [Aspergillus taichungensis]|uniref:DUF6604 domain-containing protein n=1 Tax=Aspergillus taichungensis TaxID=482145 RepID=A0A2J5HQ65_9EURO|nr:hypothetical protein BDW42DRAFT_128105 [Aspergillus taichungensis]